MKIDVIGSGSAFSKINNTSALHISDEAGKQWLIDCGPTVPRALWQRHIDVNAIDVIYFTHIHPDHSTGLTALLNNWKSFKRHKALQIYCQREQREPLQALVSLAVWPETSICFEIIWHDIEEAFSWQNWHLQTASTQHEMSNKAIRINVDNQVLFYSGDGRPTAASEALMQGADLAFQECASFKSLAKDSSHGDYADCVRLLKQGGIGHLGLYHCFDEAIVHLQQAAQSIDNLFVSQDGLSLNLAQLPSSIR